MRTTGVSELKANLSETLARVKAGEEILVTEHGRPIARLMPLAPEAPESGMQELVRRGIVKMPDSPGPLGEAFWRLPRPADPEGRVLAALLDERRSGR